MRNLSTASRMHRAAGPPAGDVENCLCLGQRCGRVAKGGAEMSAPRTTARRTSGEVEGHFASSPLVRCVEQQGFSGGDRGHRSDQLAPQSACLGHDVSVGVTSVARTSSKVAL